MEEQNQEYLNSLKSIETENYIDRLFYRPLGFKIARSIKHTGITPNTITIISIFVGIAGGIAFYYDNIAITILGILGLILANILDCVDGQLARMTGVKSEIGRILDGFAGDLWFITIYTALSLRIYNHTGYGIVFLFAVLSALSHFSQAALTDYYKTLHLFFLSPDKGKEFESIESIRTRLRAMPKGINKIFTFLYLHYTRLQFHLTPRLQAMLKSVNRLYPDHHLPESVRLTFRRGSMIVMKAVDLLTFNGRTIPLFIILLTGQVWFYFVYEIIFLNIILVVSRTQHEALCSFFNKKLVEDN